MAYTIGGSKVTFWNFVAMAGAALGVIRAVQSHWFGGFVAMFLVLFATTGLGNGSTYRMIPVILRNEKLRHVARGGAEALDEALRAAEGATVLGFVSAIGACGGYLVPRAFGATLKATVSVAPAFGAFVAFYTTCIGLTSVCYMADQGQILAPADAPPSPGSEAQV